MTSKIAPILPARSMDFNTLHDALAKGDSDEAAIAKACGEKPATKAPTDSSDKADKKG
ncbi:hypothetical protein [Parasphingorhabdus sp.]|uniref:hypothetical protein n=1 Tax=Parasphingorhabdus sp. TaxID=2709688 RepID=UPI003A94D6E9